MTDAARDLASFLTASPSPYHAVAEAVRRLSAAGFVEQPEDAPWIDGAGGRYLVRDGTVLAWWQPETLGERPLRIFAAHTDSPGFKVKPNPDVGTAGWRQVGVEVYGGALWNSWLDRDLGLAGRVALYDGSVLPVRVDRPLLRIPQLAVHLDRGVNNEGLKLDPQRHLLPIWGLGEPDEGEFLDFVAALADIDAEEIAAHDLFTFDLTPPATLGRDDELFAAPRLDNLSSVHAGIAALLEAVERGPETVPVFVGFDHEEVGSDSATGAAGPLLETLLTRLAGGFDARRTVFARSRCLSVDVTHAAHPNHLDKHDVDHLSVPNRGPSLKVNAVQRYATDAPGAAAWKRACRTADVPNQVFVSKNTVPCGSTVGPIMATRLGIRTIDVGIPVLSMHSARELCGVHDPKLLRRAGVEFLADPER
ncbi:M18 family aminopeptidase [Pseudonocardia phyllosphaerae]|uniref:M18 family aminopeptidase n=1 Tax=Pseudonocardia phyllosphaerae TaxID=3390502 RepID=UPI00397CFCB3